MWGGLCLVIWFWFWFWVEGWGERIGCAAKEREKGKRDTLSLTGEVRGDFLDVDVLVVDEVDDSEHELDMRYVC